VDLQAARSADEDPSSRTSMSDSGRVQPKADHRAPGQSLVEARSVVLGQQIEALCTRSRERFGYQGGPDALSPLGDGDDKRPDDPVDIAIGEDLDRTNNVLAPKRNERRYPWCGKGTSDPLGVVPQLPTFGDAESRDGLGVGRTEALDGHVGHR